jgi:hypothetical protein
MAYVTAKLQAPEYSFDNPTVMIMTDRKDLTDKYNHPSKKRRLQETKFVSSAFR